jgi:hypothetical protein
MSSVERIAAVANGAAEYLHCWHARSGNSSSGDTIMWSLPHFAAVALLAAGCGPARAPTCESTLRRVRVTYPKDLDVMSFAFPDQVNHDVVCWPVLQRALSLLRPGELRAIRVADPQVLDLLQGHSSDAVAAQAAVGPLRAVAWSESGSGESAFAFIEPHTASLLEIDCFPQKSSSNDRLLARCTRLESLTYANRYEPNAWLGLSQLHTLRGVDLCVVSVATIAAALPRLHTLDAYLFAGGVTPLR